MQDAGTDRRGAVRTRRARAHARRGRSTGHPPAVQATTGRARRRPRGGGRPHGCAPRRAVEGADGRGPRGGQRPALRGAGTAVPAHARPRAEVLLRAVAGGRRPGRVGGDHARRDHGACPARRRAGHPGARVRLGFADAGHGAALPQRPHHGRELQRLAEGVHRGEGRGPRRRGGDRHLEHRRPAARPDVRPRRQRRDVRARPQPPPAARSHLALAPAGRQAVRASLLSP